MGRTGMGHKNFRTTFCFASAHADVWIVCRHCRHEKIVSGGDFWRLFHMATIPLHDARKRLRCDLCQRNNPKVAPVPPMR
jgi:hypothetical protein